MGHFLSDDICSCLDTGFTQGIKKHLKVIKLILPKIKPEKALKDIKSFLFGIKENRNIISYIKSYFLCNLKWVCAYHGTTV